ncbi:MAG: hypothetical protein C0412_21765 [Flavobacterium sp.]|nr:hypothetical protein [Flavobacterium sp.]
MINNFKSDIFVFTAISALEGGQMLNETSEILQSIGEIFKNQLNWYIDKNNENNEEENEVKEKVGELFKKYNEVKDIPLNEYRNNIGAVKTCLYLYCKLNFCKNADAKEDSRYSSIHDLIRSVCGINNVDEKKC